ncbi:matrix metalloproteinase-20-like [Trichomycterus rosablanca]|uniref:matrix metalloproteinase-20-like n=1 Tax=Trichomycterus rosablanca TaxID=2290929 RepID=UPI002F350B48
MGFFFAPTIAWAFLAAQCLSAPLLKFENVNATEHQHEDHQNDLILASQYLQRFFSFSTHPTARWKRSRPSFSSKLKDMQGFFGLNQTGSLNSETLAVIKTPRCGVSDVQEYSSNRANRWNKNVISYRIGKYTNDLPTNTVDFLIGSAFDVWARASPLRFVRSSSQQADIMVEFASKYHGDYYPFDGPRGTLAHAFDPGAGVGGDVHFDEDEQWTDGSKGFNLQLVAAHEFGHALGLRHSQSPESLMYPMYKYKHTQNLLSTEDIRNINALYGTSYYTPRLSWNWHNGFFFPSAVKDKCDPDLSFDSVTNVRKEIIFFKDRYLWIKNNNKNDTKEGPINKFLLKINSSIDAAYWVARRSTVYLFSGSRYWTVKGSQVTSREKKISNFGFPDWVNKIDAAVHIPKTAHTLFFTQNQYWRYNENQNAMEDSYPRNISEDFNGIKTPISAAVYKHGFLYFFVEADIYQYDVKLKKIVTVNKASSWLGC